jgi:WD40 repeat protein
MLWSRTEEGPTRILQGHTDAICGIITHDNLLISDSLDNTIRIWDPTTTGCIRVLEVYPSYASLLRTAGGANGKSVSGTGKMGTLSRHVKSEH